MTEPNMFHNMDTSRTLIDELRELRCRDHGHRFYSEPLEASSFYMYQCWICKKDYKSVREDDDWYQWVNPPRICRAAHRCNSHSSIYLLCDTCEVLWDVSGPFSNMIKWQYTTDKGESHWEHDLVIGPVDNEGKQIHINDDVIFAPRQSICEV